MTPEKILEMARKAGFGDLSVGKWDFITALYPWLESFAALVREDGAKAEREECEKACEALMESFASERYTTDPLGGYRERFAVQQCLEAIRARTT